jgi:hypothetical protein
MLQVPGLERPSIALAIFIEVHDQIGEQRPSAGDQEEHLSLLNSP